MDSLCYSLFHHVLPPKIWEPGNDYCLLAMKEDEEKTPPDAAPDSIPPRAFVSASSHTRTRSSDTEIVDAYEDLMEVALLFSNETGLLDIFHSFILGLSSSIMGAGRIESGMHCGDSSDLIGIGLNR